MKKLVMKDQIIWTPVKKVDKDGEVAYLKGAFTEVVKAIKSGNVVKGIALKPSAVGFMFSIAEEVDLEEFMGANEVVKEVEKPKDSSIGIEYVEKKVQILNSMDECSKIIAKEMGISQEKLLEKSITRGFFGFLEEETVKKFGKEVFDENVKDALGMTTSKGIESASKDIAIPEHIRDMIKKSLGTKEDDSSNKMLELLKKSGLTPVDLDSEEMPREVQDLLKAIREIDPGAEIKVKKVELNKKKPSRWGSFWK